MSTPLTIEVNLSPELLPPLENPYSDIRYQMMEIGLDSTKQEINRKNIKIYDEFIKKTKTTKQLIPIMMFTELEDITVPSFVCWDMNVTIKSPSLTNLEDMIITKKGNIFSHEFTPQDTVNNFINNLSIYRVENPIARDQDRPYSADLTWLELNIYLFIKNVECEMRSEPIPELSEKSDYPIFEKITALYQFMFCLKWFKENNYKAYRILLD
jgi:hypothetical protein